MSLSVDEVRAWTRANRELAMREDATLLVQRTSITTPDKVTIVTHVIDKYGDQSLTVDVDGHVRYVWTGERDEEVALTKLATTS